MAVGTARQPPVAQPRTDLPRAVVGGAALLTGVLLLLAGRYGPHRDELYFAVAGQHPAWGYPDQPPLTPLLAGLAHLVAPQNLVVLRLVSAVAMGALVVVSALTARELGGRRAGQLLTALVVGTGVITAVVGHLLSTSTLDLLVWAAVVLLALRALLRDDPRWWVPTGAVAGLGLENKSLVAFLLLGIAVGVLAVRDARHQLRSPWLWGGAAVALALWAPNLVWQAVNGWPQLALAQDIDAEYRVPVERVFYVVLQLIMFSPLAAVVWVLGLVRLLRDPGWARARPVAVAWLVLFVVFAVSGGKGYYLAGLLPALLAAGCVTLERRWATPRLVAAGVLLALCALVAWPSAVPLLPARAFAGSFYAALGEDQLETIGWPALATTVQQALDAVPAEKRGSAVVLTQNYGEAGALEWYGVSAPVYSGHNGFGAWGPPRQDAAPVVVVGYDDPATDFLGCRRSGVVDNGVAAHNDEQGGVVYTCDGPRGGWRAAWPQLEHLDG